jgi:hypothetical protein
VVIISGSGRNFKAKKILFFVIDIVLWGRKYTVSEYRFRQFLVINEANQTKINQERGVGSQIPKAIINFINKREGKFCL